MRGVNKVILIGHLGKDPEVRHLQNDVSVANFTLATSDSYKDKQGNKVDQTEWHNVVMWRGLAKTAETYLKKGSLIYLEGKLQTRSWDDKEGNKRYTTEIVADTFHMLDRKSESSESGYREQRAGAAVNQPVGATANQVAPEAAEEQYADDLPF